MIKVTWDVFKLLGLNLDGLENLALLSIVEVFGTIFNLIKSADKSNHVILELPVKLYVVTRNYIYYVCLTFKFGRDMLHQIVFDVLRTRRIAIDIRHFKFLNS